jgi:hypothetical protein
VFKQILIPMSSAHKTIIILFFALIAKSNYAQVSAIPYYNNLHFQGSFFLLAENDARSNFYTVDLTRFSSEFEKRYFLDQAFKEIKLVRVDAGNMNVAWFKTEKIYSDSEIGHIFQSLQQRTIAESSAMSEVEKTEWTNRINK